MEYIRSEKNACWMLLARGDAQDAWSEIETLLDYPRVLGNTMNSPTPVC